MHRNQPGLYTNNLSGHASLLLSASPTIITSALQNSTSNNPRTSPLPPSPNLHVRRQPSTPLLSASNLDNDGHANTDSPLINSSNEGYINFKKPQNEMFKKLDGKIQKIVAAHSNLNKLYALNDFPSLGTGPKRAFELPPQLPPPPPWVPKVSPDFNNQWKEDGSESPGGSSGMDSSGLKESPEYIEPNRIMRKPINRDLKPFASTPNEVPSLTIDLAISKLHQRRQQQQLGKKATDDHGPDGPVPGSSSSNCSTPSITPAQFSLLTQKIKETLEAECATKTQGGNLSIEDKKRFQEDLIALLRDEITSATKTAKFKFNPASKAEISEQQTLLMKSSPQSLFNTIRRETSLLLSKREQLTSTGRSSLSLLLDQQTFNRQNGRENASSIHRQPINKVQHTIKVIVPPIEYQQNSKPNDKESTENLIVPTEPSSKSIEGCLTKESILTYQVIKKRIRLFQESSQIYLGKLHKSSYSENFGLKKKRDVHKSLDKIVDRLQAKCSSSTTEPDISPNFYSQKSVSLKQQIINSSASLLQSSRNAPPMSAPTPIPVFRPPLTATSKGEYYYGSSAGATKVVNIKSKMKKIHHFGLKIGNYLEKECPQPNHEKMTLEQYAKCLNLVRANDISLQLHQEQLQKSETRWRMPVGNRPLRLRRIRGERIHMPASASYKATRKVGLQ